jgi:hypothetical protein
MSETDQFRQYAEEAMRWVRQSKTEKEKQVLIELARTWTQAKPQNGSTTSSPRWLLRSTSERAMEVFILPMYGAI